MKTPTRCESEEKFPTKRKACINTPRLVRAWLVGIESERLQGWSGRLVGSEMSGVRAAACILESMMRNLGCILPTLGSCGDLARQDT